MNPNAIAILWAFTILMAGAIALGPVFIYVIGALTVVYTTLSLGR